MRRTVLALLVAFATLGTVSTSVHASDDGGGMWVLDPYKQTTTVHESYEWTEETPKGVVGHDGIRCVATTTQSGHTVKFTSYVGADAGMMTDEPDRERAWQEDHCRYMTELQMGWWFQQRGADFNPDLVKYTYTRL